MRVVTDPGVCAGTGQCVLIQPAVFDQSDDDGTVVLLVEHVEGEQLAAVEDAVHACPTEAISLEAD